jgi:DNA-binding MarR family transcriptional regulator
VSELFASQTAVLKLECFLPHRLAVLASSGAEALAPIYAQHGLSQSEWVVLAAIAERPRTSAKAIGATFHMQKSKVSRAVRTLLDRNLIMGTLQPRDRRLIELTLTQQGTVVYRLCGTAIADFARKLESVLTPADRHVLLRNLAQLAHTCSSTAFKKVGQASNNQR